MKRAKHIASVTLLLVVLVFVSGGFANAQGTNDASLKLYVFDLGELESDPAGYNLTESEVQTTSLSLAAYLVVHPRGVLLWEAGAVPESERVMEGTGARQIVIRSDGKERPVILGPSMLEQLKASGYVPADINYLALSHFHWDHSANANLFAHATWLVRPEEREAMFPDAPMHNSARPMTYANLRNSKTILIKDEEYDVFGDGRVILKAARGHSPGHQVLYVDLAKTGGVVLSGDLYHFPEERSLNRLPANDYDVEQTRQSRIDLEDFLTRHHAQLWIEHDLIGHRQLKKAPEYYE